jgi:hypothetical protein
MNIMDIIKKISRYCVSKLKAHSIGTAAVVFAVSVFLLLFLFIRPIFFPNFLETNFDTDEERSNHVIEQLAPKPPQGACLTDD